MVCEHQVRVELKLQQIRRERGEEGFHERWRRAEEDGGDGDSAA